MLYTLALQKTGQPAEAEDRVQELFIDLSNRREGLALVKDLKAYLVAATYNKIFRYFRDKGINEQHLPDFGLFLQHAGHDQQHLFSVSATFETEFGRLQDIIDATILLMPPRMQAVATHVNIGSYYSGQTNAIFYRLRPKQ